ncbi:hypothetical protein Fmac_024102 [Flemingia macrophylla]|uniref:Uncharacterized protein n=1 Tax=Flemingia macrophylla TaxID=520843 RepID=A0ABD1LNF9_9FABA
MKIFLETVQPNWHATAKEMIRQEKLVVDLSRNLRLLAALNLLSGFLCAEQILANLKLPIISLIPPSPSRSLPLAAARRHFR